MLSSRATIFRSKAIGCKWAARIATDPGTRRLFRQLAGQWLAMAEEVEQLEALRTYWDRSPPPTDVA